MRTLEEFLSGVASRDGQQLTIGQKHANAEGCPACGAIPARRPKRKTACKDCGEQIFVRKGALVLSDEALLFDEFAGLAAHGAHAEDLVQTLREMVKQGDGSVRAADVIWTIYNRLLLPIAPRGLLGRLRPARPRTSAELSLIYNSMASFLRREGKDNRHILEEAHKHNLMTIKTDLQLSPSDRVICVIGVPDDRQCGPCRALQDRRMTVDEALQELPAPRVCTSEEGYCRCCYGYDPFDE